MATFFENEKDILIEDNNLYKIVGFNRVNLVACGHFTAEEVEIPEIISAGFCNYKVVSAEDSAFAACPNLKKIRFKGYTDATEILPYCEGKAIEVLLKKTKNNTSSKKLKRLKKEKKEAKKRR